MDNNENLEVQQEQPNVEKESTKTTSNHDMPKIGNTPKLPPKSKKPFYKKWWFWVIIGVLLISIVAGGGNKDSNSENPDINNSSNNNNSGSNSNSNNESQSNLGSYHVVIDSYRLAEDYQGKPIIIVKYKFTNNSSESASFSSTLNDTVYQNGVGLNECYLTDDSAKYSSDNQMKDIKTGVTLDVEVAYYLNDSTTPIEVEVSRYISLNNKKVTKTFTIAPNNSNNQNSSSNQNNTTSNLGQYNIIIDSYRLAEDLFGNPIVIVKYKFTNNSSGSAAFYTTLDTNVYQNGIGLNESYFVDDSANYSSSNQTKEIKAGVTLDIEVAYELNNTTTPIEVEVTEWISLNNKKVEKTFTIN